MANELITLDQAAKEIDKITNECAPLALQESETFSMALKVADGVKKLRQLFLSHAGIKEIITAMQDTRLGFLTDRSPKALSIAKATGKTLNPYTYNEIAECCIEGMLKGYRITNNEINVIAGNFYPAKNGKYRKIIEYPGVTDFQFTTTTPAYDSDGKYAKVQGWASWKKDGIKITLGNSDPEKGVQDTQVFKIRVNAYMGEDAIIGKAQSKLFSRVMERLTGKVQPETTDIEYGETEPVIDITAENTQSKAEALKAKLKKAKDPQDETPEAIFKCPDTGDPGDQAKCLECPKFQVCEPE